MYTSRHRSSSPLGSRYRSTSSSRSFRDSYTSPSFSTTLPMNPSIRRVKDLDLGISDRFSALRASPPPSNFLPDSTSSNLESKRVLQRLSNDFDSPSISMKSQRDSSLDFSLRVGRSYISTPLPFSSFRSASKRVDYSDFIKPVLRDRPVLKTNYVPRSRAERERACAPISRDRKLIKFREVGGNIKNEKRKLSWAIPDDLGLFSLDDLGVDSSGIKHEEPVRSRESSLSRIRSRENSLTRIHSPRASITGGSSRESSLSRLRSPRTSVANCRSREHSLSRADALKPPTVSSPRISADRRPSSEFCGGASAVKSSKNRYTDHSDLTSHATRSAHDGMIEPASGFCKRTLSDELYSENKAEPKIDYYDTYTTVRRRRRPDSPAELETERNETVDAAIRSRRRRRRSRFLEISSELGNSFDVDEMAEHKSHRRATRENKIRETPEKDGSVKYDTGPDQKDNLESFLPHGAAKTKGKICAQDKKFPQQGEISVSYVLPGPKQTKLRSSEAEKSKTFVDRVASTTTPAESKTDETNVSICLNMNEPKISHVRLKSSESKLMKDTLKLKTDKDISGSGKCGESINKTISADDVVKNGNFTKLNKTSGKMGPSLVERKVQEPKKDSFSSTSVDSLSASATSSNKLTGRYTSIGLRRGVSVESKMNSNVTNLLSPVENTAKTETKNLRLDSIDKNAVNNVNIENENKKQIPRLAKKPVEKETEMAANAVSKKIESAEDRNFKIESKVTSLSKDTDATISATVQKNSEKRIHVFQEKCVDNTSKAEPKNSKLGCVDKKTVQGVCPENEGSRHIPGFAEMPVPIGEDAGGIINVISKQKQCSQDENLKIGSKRTAVSKKTDVKVDATIQKDDSEKNILPTLGKMNVDNVMVQAMNSERDSLHKNAVQSNENEGKKKQLIPHLATETVCKDTALATDVISKQKQGADENRNFKIDSRTDPFKKDAHVKRDVTVQNCSENKTFAFEKKTVDNTLKVEAKNLEHDDIDKKAAQNVNIENEGKKYTYNLTKKPLTVQKDVGVIIDESSKQKRGIEGRKIIPTVPKGTDVKIGDTVKKDTEKKIIFGVERNIVNNTAVVEDKKSNLDAEKNAIQNVNENKPLIPLLDEKPRQKDIVVTNDSISKQKQSIEDKNLKIESKIASLSKDITIQKHSENKKALAFEKTNVDNTSKDEAKISKLNNIDNNSVQKVNVEIEYKKLIPRFPKKPAQEDVVVATDIISKQKQGADGDINLKVESDMISLLKDADTKIDATVQKDSDKKVLLLEKQLDNTSKVQPKISKPDNTGKNAEQSVNIESEKFIPSFKKAAQKDTEVAADVISKQKQGTEHSNFKGESKITFVLEVTDVKIDATVWKDSEKKIIVLEEKSIDSTSNIAAKNSNLGNVDKNAASNANIENKSIKGIPHLAKKTVQNDPQVAVSVIPKGTVDGDFETESGMTSFPQDIDVKINTTADKFIKQESKISQYVTTEGKAQVAVESKGTSVTEKVSGLAKKEAFGQIYVSVDKNQKTNREEKISPLPAKVNVTENKIVELHNTDTRVIEDKTAIRKNVEISNGVQPGADERKVPNQNEDSASKGTDKTACFRITDIKNATENRKRIPDQKEIDENLKTNENEDSPHTGDTNVEVDVTLKIKKFPKSVCNIKDRRISKDDLTKDATDFKAAGDTQKDMMSEYEDHDIKARDELEKFVVKISNFKTASAIIKTGDGQTSDRKTAVGVSYPATDEYTVKNSLNMAPEKVIFTDTPVTVDEKDKVLNINEANESGCRNISSNEKIGFHADGKIELKAESKFGFTGSKEMEILNRTLKNNARTQNTAVYGRNIMAAKTENLPIVSKKKESEDSISLENDIFDHSGSVECWKECTTDLNASAIPQALSPAPRNKTPDRKEVVIDKDLKNEYFGVDDTPKNLKCLLSGERKPSTNIGKEISLAPKEIPSFSERDEKESSKAFVEDKAPFTTLSKTNICATDPNKCHSQGICDESNQTEVDFVDVSEKEKGVIPINKILDGSGISNVEEISSAMLPKTLTIPTKNASKISVCESQNASKISVCESQNAHKIISVESQKPAVTFDLEKNAAKSSQDISKSVEEKSSTLDTEKCVSEKTFPPDTVEVITKIVSSSAERNEENSENKIGYVGRKDYSDSGQAKSDGVECKKVTVHVQDAKPAKIYSTDSVSPDNVNALRAKPSAVPSAIPEAESSSSEKETSEEETSSEEEESTSDGDNRLPGTWGPQNGNVASGKKRRFIGLMTKTALNEKLSSLKTQEQQNVDTAANGRLSSGSDERTRSRSQLSPGSIGCDNTYVSFSSPFSSPTEVSTLFDDSPSRRTSSASQQEKYLKLRFRKYTLDDFQFLKLLGKGSFGKVLLAELKGHDMFFAIKCLKKDVVLEDDDVEGTMIERRILALGTQHPYMCKLYCTFQTDSHLFFVMEYLNGGDLMFHIQESGRFDQDRARFYGAEITSALKFLHKKGIVYRDIKLDNIVMDEQGHIRLVDFGMCQCRVYKEECMPFNFCGTPQYIAPEIVKGQTYNQSVDWWSFGVLLYEMLTGRSPFNGTDEDELFWSVCNEEPHYPRFLTKEARQLIELLLIKNPSQRLGMPSCSAGDVTVQPFFSSINWSLLEAKQIQPPFKPSTRSACDTSNFDSSFTMDSATLSPVESEILQSMDQAQFRGFSYTNPHITG